MITLSESVKKIEQIIKEIEKSGFEVSLIGEIRCSCSDQQPPIIGSSTIFHNPKK